MFIDNPVNTYGFVFPMLECLHIGGFALAIGMTALVDFRLLGLGMRHSTPARIAGNTGWWMLGGLVVAVFSGLLLFSSDPDMYYLNWAFLIKMACLVLAIVFNYTIHRKAVFSGVSTVGARLVACTSLALWVSIVWGGIFIAFIRPGLT